MMVVAAVLIIVSFSMVFVFSPFAPLLAGSSAAAGSVTTGSIAGGVGNVAIDAAVISETASVGSVWLNHAMTISKLGLDFFGMPATEGAMYTIWEIPSTPMLLTPGIARLVRKQDAVNVKANHTVEVDFTAFYNDHLDRALSHIYPAPVLSDDKLTPDVRYGAYGMAEGLIASDLQVHPDGASVYDQVEVKSGCKFR